MPLKIFLVFYTASGGIASVSKSQDDMEWCERIANERNEQNLRGAKTDADIYVAECEQHKTPPKVTVKIDSKTRETLQVSCVARGLRKATGRRLAEVGATTKEIMSILGHTTLAEAERYTEEADQIGLAEDAVIKLEARIANKAPQTASSGLGKSAKTEKKST
jgi:hypothetical protein